MIGDLGINLAIFFKKLHQVLLLSFLCCVEWKVRFRRMAVGYAFLSWDCYWASEYILF